MSSMALTVGGLENHPFLNCRAIWPAKALEGPSISLPAGHGKHIGARYAGNGAPVSQGKPACFFSYRRQRPLMASLPRVSEQSSQRPTGSGNRAAFSAIRCLEKRLFDGSLFNFTLVDPIRFELPEWVGREALKNNLFALGEGKGLGDVFVRRA